MKIVVLPLANGSRLAIPESQPFRLTPCDNKSSYMHITDNTGGEETWPIGLSFDETVAKLRAGGAE